MIQEKTPPAMQNQAHIREDEAELFLGVCMATGKENVTGQLWICLCSYQTVSEGPAHPTSQAQVQEVCKTHAASPGQLPAGSSLSLAGLPSALQTRPLLRGPRKSSSAWDPQSFSHLPANATIACSLGSELALSESQEIFYFRGRAGMGERKEISQALGSVLAALNALFYSIFAIVL